MKSILNHVAILVENIEAVLNKNLFKADVLNEIEEFESEGTRELYIGPDKEMGRLLLMQANGNGPYMDALKKRGAGLHHIAIDVLDIDEFVKHLSGSGWLLHPKSLELYKSHKQIYLSRPGVPTLIEVQERKKNIVNNYFINQLDFPFGEVRLLDSLFCDQLKMSDEIKINIDGETLSIKDLLS